VPCASPAMRDACRLSGSMARRNGIGLQGLLLALLSQALFLSGPARTPVRANGTLPWDYHPIDPARAGPGRAPCARLTNEIRSPFTDLAGNRTAHRLWRTLRRAVHSRNALPWHRLRLQTVHDLLWHAGCEQSLRPAALQSRFMQSFQV
jgi:hypothetical protein